MLTGRSSGGGDVRDARPVIMDCTIRDGSYAVDFKFTAADTALVVGLLDDAGLPYIEIGHGLGLGAGRAGEQAASCTDAEAIERSRERPLRARLGAFFIPGVGNERDLHEAAAAGLDFVRVGNNADEMDAAWPSLQIALSAGLESFVNVMKTYGIPPSAFAEIAVEAERRGAAGVYVVDSAGGMLPGEVAEYVRAARERTTLPIGFHGHSNLQLAVANALAAIEAGATFIDTSVYGIGRSSGNVPTEVLAVVLERMGVESGLDAQMIIGLAESYLRPLAENLHPHDMTAVALGYGRFHSSYLPRALRAADEAGIDPLRLIVALGRRDTMRLSEDLLRDTVAQLRGTPRRTRREDLTAFTDERFGPRRIASRPQALGELLDALEVTAAKRRLAVALDLVPSVTLDEEATSVEFVLEDTHMALGRLRFGSTDAALRALGAHGSRVAVGLVDCADRATLLALGEVLPGRLVPYRSDELELEYLGDVVLARAVATGADTILLADPGTYAAPLVQRLARRLAAVAEVLRGGREVEWSPGTVSAVAGPLGSVSGAGVADAVFLGRREGEARPPLATVLGRQEAYRDTLPRWRRALVAQPLSEPLPTAS
jgi:4-hydroxy 2-oxovalerate aldolase